MQAFLILAMLVSLFQFLFDKENAFNRNYIFLSILVFHYYSCSVLFWADSLYVWWQYSIQSNCCGSIVWSCVLIVWLSYADEHDNHKGLLPFS